MYRHLAIATTISAVFNKTHPSLLYYINKDCLKTRCRSFIVTRSSSIYLLLISNVYTLIWESSEVYDHFIIRLVNSFLRDACAKNDWAWVEQHGIGRDSRNRLKSLYSNEVVFECSHINSIRHFYRFFRDFCWQVLIIWKIRNMNFDEAINIQTDQIWNSRS